MFKKIMKQFPDYKLIFNYITIIDKCQMKLICNYYLLCTRIQNIILLYFYLFQATRKAVKCGYLFVAPGRDFTNPINRTKVRIN